MNRNGQVRANLATNGQDEGEEVSLDDIVTVVVVVVVVVSFP